MEKNLYDNINKYVEDNIIIFHNNRINKLKDLKFTTILKRKNPYLFRAKNMNTANDIVKSILDAHLSSGEETIFGNWLEGLAIYISDDLLKKGKKSSSPGIDLEIVDNDYHYLISIKSGPNWGNSSQVKKLETDFINAKRSVKTSNYKKEIKFINGCCYGRKQECLIQTKSIEYYKICGQFFWEFISGMENLYKDIIIPIGYKADKMNEEYNLVYANTINIFTKNFISEFCKETGEIDWERVLKLSSAKFESNNLNILT